MMYSPFTRYYTVSVNATGVSATLFTATKTCMIFAEVEAIQTGGSSNNTTLVNINNTSNGELYFYAFNDGDESSGSTTVIRGYGAKVCVAGGSVTYSGGRGVIGTLHIFEIN